MTQPTAGPLADGPPAAVEAVPAPDGRQAGADRSSASTAVERLTRRALPPLPTTDPYPLTP